MGGSGGGILQAVGTIAGIIGMFMPGMQVYAFALMMACNMAGGYLNAQEAKKKMRGADSMDYKFEQGGHLVNTRSTNDPVPVIFGGTLRVGGNQVFMTTTGDSNEYMNIIQTICEGPIDTTGMKVLLDDKYSDDEFYDGYVDVEIFDGSRTQVVCASLNAVYPDWQDAMRGTAYVYVKLKYNQDKFQSVPLITVEGKFLKLYDPRTATTAWSDNGALAIYYLLTSKRGLGIPTDVINAQSFKDVANSCDSLGFKFNAIINGRDAGLDTIEKCLLNFRGFVSWIDGIYKLKQYAYDSPVMTITEDDIVADSFEINLPGLPETPNRLKVKFIDPEKKYTISDFIYEDLSAITIEGMEREHEFNLIGTASYDQAVKLSAFHLERQRLNKSYTFSIGSKGIQLETGDTIAVTHTLPGWTAQIARVEAIVYAPDFTTTLTVLEESADLYNTVLDVSPHSFFTGNFPDPTAFPTDVTGVNLSEEMYRLRTGVFTRLFIDMSVPSSQIDYLEIWTSATSGSGYTHYTDISGSQGAQRVIIDPVPDGATIYIKVRPVSIHGVKKALADITEYSRYVIGKTAVPDDVTSFWAQASLGGIRLDWTPIDDVDLDYYELRYNSDTTANGQWDNSIHVSKSYTTSITLPAGKSGKYLIKAVDTSGNKSATAAELTTTIPTILGWNVQQTLTEHPAFSGTKTNMYVDGGKLYPASSDNFDSAEMFDNDNQYFDLGGGAVLAGYYETSVVALGSVQTCRCTGSVKFTCNNALQYFDDDVDLMDNSEMFDGDTSKSGITLQIALSQDGSTWSAWQNFFAGDYTAKSIKFRLYAWSTDAYQYVEITELTFNVDMPDRIVKSSVPVTVPVSGYRITIAPPFINIQDVGLSVFSAQNGDEAFFTVVDNSTVDIWVDNSGTPVQRQMAYTIIGY